MKRKDYWKNRFDQVEQAANNQAVDYQQTLERKYRIALRNIEGKISAWYERFAENNNITVSEARRLLTSDELEELRWDILDYIKHGEENALTQEWLKELENASAKFHISRFEALKLRIRQEIEVLTGSMPDDVDELLSNVYSDTYYRSIFEVQRGVGIGFTVADVDSKKLSKLLQKPWSVNGINFSENIWQNKTKLINVLDQELSRMIMTGASPKNIIRNVQTAMNTSKSNATRLVMTEQAYFTTLAQKDAFKELDVEEFEIVATLDGITCDTCGSHDGKHYPLKYMETAVNAPPFHPYCRCTTCPYFDDMDGYRASRNAAGKTVYEIPANMKYTEWKKEYVQQDGSDKQT